jgi:hypothetical protein
MLLPAGDPPDIRFRHDKSGWVIFVKKQATKREKDQEQMRKRLENSLPWSLSRWLAKMLGRKRK